MFSLSGGTPSAVQSVASTSPIADLVLFDRRAVGAGAAVGLAAGDAAAGEHARPGGGEMIAAGLRVDLRRAAELAHPQDRRAVEQAALVELGHQRGPAGVELGGQPLDLA